MSSNQIHYQDYRKDFKDGDILMFKGKGLFSWMIRWKTKSEYSHAGIVAWWNDRLMVLEAVGKGVVARPISYSLKHYHGSFDYYKLKDETGITDAKRSEMLIFAQEQIGKEYDGKAVVMFFFKLLFKSKLNPNDHPNLTAKFFCSHYVAAIYNKVKLDLIPNLSDELTSPKRIAASDLLKFVGTVKEESIT